MKQWFRQIIKDASSYFSSINDLNPEIRDIYAKMLSDEVSKQYSWVKPEISNNTRSDNTTTNSVEDLLDGNITPEEYHNNISNRKPRIVLTEAASEQQVRESLNKYQHSKIDIPIQPGSQVGLRLNIPSLTRKNIGVVTIHDTQDQNRVVSYTNVARIRNAVFQTNPNAALSVASGEKNKFPMAQINGEWVGLSGYNMKERGLDAKNQVQNILSDPDWVQVGMNPRQASYFYSLSRFSRPVVSASEVIQIGNLVYAKNPVYGRPQDFGTNSTNPSGQRIYFQDNFRTDRNYKSSGVSNNIGRHMLGKGLIDSYVVLSQGEYNQALSTSDASRTTPRAFISNDILYLNDDAIHTDDTFADFMDVMIERLPDYHLNNIRDFAYMTKDQDRVDAYSASMEGNESTQDLTFLAEILKNPKFASFSDDIMEEIFGYKSTDPVYILPGTEENTTPTNHTSTTSNMTSMLMNQAMSQIGLNMEQSLKVVQASINEYNNISC